MRRGLLLLAAVGLVACAPAAPPAVASTPIGAAPTPPTDADHTVELHLDHAPMPEALAAMGALSAEPILVDARALRALGCVSLSIDEPAKLPSRAAVERLAETVRARGFVVTHAAGQWIVSVPSDDWSPCSADVLAEIREISPTEHVITRRALDTVASDVSSYTKTLRTVPEQENGVVVGLRIFGVRPDTLAGKLGFDNGDRILRIAGRPITSTASAADAWRSALQTNEIVIEINRRGQPARLVVRVE